MSADPTGGAPSGGDPAGGGGGAVQATKLAVQPKVFLSPAFEDAIAFDLKQKIIQLGGSIVPSSSFPGISHVISTSTSAKAMDAEEKTTGTWCVSSKWVEASTMSQEWLNEKDYCVEADKEVEGKRPRGQELEGEGEGERPSKKEKLGEVQLTPIDIQPPESRNTEDVPTPTLAGTTSEKDAAKDREEGADQRPESAEKNDPSPVPAQSAVAGTSEKDAAKSIEVDAQQKPENVEKKELYPIPAHAAWFEWDKIHMLERSSLPEFFNGKSASKTARIYKDYRDFLMNKYREDTTQKMNFTECRKYLSGDVNAIYRVYAFLDHWGLINFDARKLKVDSSKKDVSVGLPTQLEIVQNAKGNKIDSLLAFDEKGPTNAKLGIPSVSLITKKDMSGISPAESAGKQLQFICNISGKDCTQVRYHCTKIPDYDLSPESFEECKNENKFPTGMTASDFIRIDHVANKKDDPNYWSNAETLLLLEALEVYGENWAEVAEHVGTKSQLQCISHFLSLPIEDPYLEELEGEISESNVFAKKESQLEPVPFADTGNPVMAQVAFLATMVGPKVAAAAAQKALSVLAETEPFVLASASKAPEAATGEGAEKDAEKGAGPSMNPPSSASVKAAAATGLAAAAVKAKLLADKEEREIQRLVIQLVEKQMQKLEVKMKYFEELDVLLEREREELQKARIQVCSERTALQATKLTTRPVSAVPSVKPSLTTVAPTPAPTPAAVAEPVKVTAPPAPTSAPTPAASAANQSLNPTAPTPAPTPAAAAAAAAAATTTTSAVQSVKPVVLPVPTAAAGAPDANPVGTSASTAVAPTVVTKVDSDANVNNNVPAPKSDNADLGVAAVEEDESSKQIDKDTVSMPEFPGKVEEKVEMQGEVENVKDVIMTDASPSNGAADMQVKCPTAENTALTATSPEGGIGEVQKAPMDTPTEEENRNIDNKDIKESAPEEEAAKESKDDEKANDVNPAPPPIAQGEKESAEVSEAQEVNHGAGVQEEKSKD